MWTVYFVNINILFGHFLHFTPRKYEVWAGRGSGGRAKLFLER